MRLLPNPGEEERQQKKGHGSRKSGDREYEDRVHDGPLRLQIPSRHHAWAQGTAYEMMFIESILETDTTKGFWFVSSLGV